MIGLVLIITSYYNNGQILLNQFRQIPKAFGRNLLGILLFVWLSMAISPCVMASSVMVNSMMADNTIATESMHSNMDDCMLCPDDSMNTNLCKSLHNITSDSLAYSIEAVDTDSFILFEIPVVLTMTHFSEANRFFKLQSISDNQVISPLALTGILRI